jgi:hypothetical protein
LVASIQLIRVGGVAGTGMALCSGGVKSGFILSRFTTSQNGTKWRNLSHICRQPVEFLHLKGDNADIVPSCQLSY